MKHTIIIASAVMLLSACDSTRTASGFLCPNGRPDVAITGGTGWGSSYSCNPAHQDAVDRKVAQGREYRVLSVAEADAAALNALVVGGPLPAGKIPAMQPGFGVKP